MTKQTKINMNRIEKNLPGLEAYTIPDEKQVKQYIKDLNPIKVQNNVIFMILNLFCIVANLIRIFELTDMTTRYRTVKQVEELDFLLQPATLGQPLATWLPQTKLDLITYLNVTLPQRVFPNATKATSVSFDNEFELINFSLSTFHTLVAPHDGPTSYGLDKAYTTYDIN